MLRARSPRSVCPRATQAPSLDSCVHPSSTDCSRGRFVAMVSSSTSSTKLRQQVLSCLLVLGLATVRDNRAYLTSVRSRLSRSGKLARSRNRSFSALRASTASPSKGRAVHQPERFSVASLQASSGFRQTNSNRAIKLLTLCSKRQPELGRRCRNCEACASFSAPVAR